MEKKAENIELYPDVQNQVFVSDVEVEQIDVTVSLMDKPFDPTQINIETKTPSLDTLIKRIKNKTVQLNTESYFQRNPNLWDETKQSRLIESILIQFPLPAFYFDATNENNWLVVDGLPSNLQTATNEMFLKVTGKKIDTSRMLDRDFANRFLCFYLFGIFLQVRCLKSCKAISLNIIIPIVLTIKM